VPQRARNSYDEVPYKSQPYRQTHPDRLATIATLLGMQPARLDRCRVLELGCSSGGNLLPLAEQFPESRFVGIDGSRRQIEMGRATLDAVGLKNLELQHADLRTAGAELGRFDYIIVHGVYSWVPAEVQEKILAICAEHLAPQGVAYVSYNTYPGWHMRGMIRDMMLYRVRALPEPAERIHQARWLLDFLAQSVPSEENPFGILLKQELNLLREKEDSYLFHEHLEDINEPTYFYRFVERAEAKGLQYLGEADFGIMAPSNLPAAVEAGLQSVSANVIEMEQYMDFARNRMFRQTLLCHRGVALDRTPSPERVQGMQVASAAKPENGEVDIHSTAQTTYRTPSAVLTTTERLVKAAMQRLGEEWPRAVPFDDLLASARARLAPHAVVVESSRLANDARRLAAPLLRCFTTSLVELSVHPSLFTLEISDRPLASRLARWQAESSSTVTNRRHENTHLNDLQRHTLRFLDGRHDRSGLVAELAGLVQEGTLAVQKHGQPVRDAERVRGILTDAVDATLPQLARHALVIG